MTLSTHTPRSRRGIVGPALLGAAALLAGCDKPTGPDPLQAPETFSSYENATTLGESMLQPTPEGNATSGSAVPFASVSAGSWVIFRIAGSLSLESNPACHAAATPYWACPTSATIPTFDPKPYPYGPVEVWRVTATNQSRLPVRAEGSGAVGLMKASSAATLSAKLYVSVPNWYMPGANPIPAFFVRGEYISYAQTIPSPVSLTEGAAGTGGTRQYTLTALYGLQFLNPTDPYYWANRPTPYVTWRFIPGTNVADAGYASNAVNVSACNYQTTCSYTPTGPGRMEATAQVEGREVVIRSIVAPVAPPTLSLSCPALVVRGSGATCSVSATGGLLTETQWAFEDSTGARSTGPANVTSWAGRMVARGTVIVEGKVNGTLLTDSAAIAIQPRTWASLTLAVREDSTSLPAPAAITFSGDLGETKLEMPLHPERRIPDGPNQGWWYLDRELPPLPVRVLINVPAFQPGNVWYNLQTGPAPYCAAADMPTVLMRVRSHEGSIGSLPGTKSHTDAMRDYLAANNPQDLMEGLISHDRDVASQAFASQFGAWYRAWIEGPLLGASAHTTKNPPGNTTPPNLGCDLKF